MRHSHLLLVTALLSCVSGHAVVTSEQHAPRIFASMNLPSRGNNEDYASNINHHHPISYPARSSLEMEQQDEVANKVHTDALKTLAMSPIVKDEHSFTTTIELPAKFTVITCHGPFDSWTSKLRQNGNEKKSIGVTANAAATAAVSANVEYLSRPAQASEVIPIIKPASGDIPVIRPPQGEMTHIKVLPLPVPEVETLTLSSSLAKSSSIITLTKIITVTKLVNTRCCTPATRTVAIVDDSFSEITVSDQLFAGQTAVALQPTPQAVMYPVDFEVSKLVRFVRELTTDDYMAFIASHSAEDLQSLFPQINWDSANHLADFICMADPSMDRSSAFKYAIAYLTGAGWPILQDSASTSVTVQLINNPTSPPMTVQMTENFTPSPTPTPDVLTAHWIIFPESTYTVELGESTLTTVIREGTTAMFPPDFLPATMPTNGLPIRTITMPVGWTTSIRGGDTVTFWVPLPTTGPTTPTSLPREGDTLLMDWSTIGFVPISAPLPTTAPPVSSVSALVWLSGTALTLPPQSYIVLVDPLWNYTMYALSPVIPPVTTSNEPTVTSPIYTTSMGRPPVSLVRPLPSSSPKCGMVLPGWRRRRCKLERCLWDHLKPIRITTAFHAIVQDQADDYRPSFDWFTKPTAVSRPHWGTTKASYTYYPLQTSTTCVKGQTSVMYVPEIPSTLAASLYPKLVPTKAVNFLGKIASDQPVCIDELSCTLLCRKSTNHSLRSWILFLVSILAALIAMAALALIFMRYFGRRGSGGKSPNRVVVAETTERSQGGDMYRDDAATTGRAQGLSTSDDRFRGTLGRSAEEGRAGTDGQRDVWIQHSAPVDPVDGTADFRSGHELPGQGSIRGRKRDRLGQVVQAGQT